MTHEVVRLSREVRVYISVEVLEYVLSGGVYACAGGDVTKKNVISSLFFTHCVCPPLRWPTITLAIVVAVGTAKARRSRSQSSNPAPAAFMYGLEVVGELGWSKRDIWRLFWFLHQETTRGWTALFNAIHSALRELPPLCTNHWFSMTHSQHSSTGKLQQAEQSAASGYISFMIRPSPESASITANEQNRVSTLVT